MTHNIGLLPHDVDLPPLYAMKSVGHILYLTAFDSPRDPNRVRHIYWHVTEQTCYFWPAELKHSERVSEIEDESIKRLLFARYLKWRRRNPHVSIFDAPAGAACKHS